MEETISCRQIFHHSSFGYVQQCSHQAAALRDSPKKNFLALMVILGIRTAVFSPGRGLAGFPDSQEKLFSPYGYFGQAVLSTNLIMSIVIIL